MREGERQIDEVDMAPARLVAPWTSISPRISSRCATGASDVLDDLASPAGVRAHTATAAPFDRELWRAMVDQGWLGVEVGEADGGLGLGSVEVAVLVEELGRHAAPAPFVPTVLALDVFARAGDDAWVQRLLAGDAIACVALGRGRARCRTRRRPMSPSCSPTTACTRLSSSERPRRANRRWISPASWAGCDSIPRPRARVGDVDARTRLLDRGATFTSADLLGSASHTLDLAVEYAKDRVQFGRPIGSFQAVKHRCADMLVDVEGMRSTVYWAAWCIGRRRRRARRWRRRPRRSGAATRRSG